MERSRQRIAKTGLFLDVQQTRCLLPAPTWERVQVPPLVLQQMTHMHAKLFTLDNWVKPSKSMEGKEEEEEEEEEDVSWPAV